MASDRVARFWQRQGSRLRRTSRSLFQYSHLLMVGKAAVIATAAWVVGSALPGELADYAYYAPLGALVAIAPTVASSMWSSILAVLGVLIGLAIAWVLIFSGIHGMLALFVAIGLSSLVSGISALGPGRSYIPFAAAFVFLTGGGDPEEFSLGLALQFSLGAAMGVGINLVVPPPLNVHSVRRSVAEARRSVGHCISQLGDWVTGDGPEGGAREWLWSLDEAAEKRQDAGRLLEHADHNKRGNLRTRFVDTNLSREHDVMHAMRQCLTDLYHVADLPDALLDNDAADSIRSRVISPGLAQPIAEACAALAEALGTEDPEHGSSHGDETALQHIERAHETLVTSTGLAPDIKEWMFVVVFALRRIAARVEHLEATSSSP